MPDMEPLSGAEPEDSTSRLTLHRPRREDVPELFAILSDPLVWTHLPSGRHREIERTAQAVERWDAEWERDGISTWVVRERGVAQVIGYGGLSSLDGIAWNLGYRFAVRAQGRGFATELARHAVARARAEGPALPVIAYLLEHNVASAAVARRVGLELVDRGPDAGNPDPEAVRLVFASRALSPEELTAARR